MCRNLSRYTPEGAEGDEIVAHFTISINDLSETAKAYAFAVDEAWVRQSLEATGVRPAEVEYRGALDVDVQLQGKDVIVRGRLLASVVTECARCLETARIDVDTEVVSLLSPKSAAAAYAEELELSADELDQDTYTGDEIHLDSLVREQILLDVPIQPLCAPDCSGLEVPPKVAGPQDLKAAARAATGGVDPRLAPLLSMVGKVEPTEE